MDGGSYFSDVDIIQHTNFLLLAAHDTTTSAINNIIMYSAQNTLWQDQFHQECNNLNKANIDYDDLEKLDVIDRAFQEVIRLAPPAALATRRTIRNCEIGGFKVPANTMLFLPLVFNHRDSRYWQNPDDFDPDRFYLNVQNINNIYLCLSL